MKVDERYNGWVRTKFWLERCEQGAVFPQCTSKVEKIFFLPTNGQANDATIFVYVSRELTFFLHE